MIDKLKDIIGPKCTAINVNGEISEFINVPSTQLKFCEAVNCSFNIPIKLNNSNLGCPGARRSAGFDSDDLELSKTISGNNNIPVKFIVNALEHISNLDSIRHINLGLTEYMERMINPDLYIAYVKPEFITSIMHKLLRMNIKISIPPSSLLSICGNVFANCYTNQTVSISFGCSESRKHGGIDKDEVIIGFPATIAQNLLIE